VVVVVVMVGKRKRVHARMLSLCHTHSLFIRSFIHGDFVFDHCEEKRREEERRENCISERRGGYFYYFLNSKSLVARFLLIY
jgi:hypothetical protein